MNKGVVILAHGSRAIAWEANQLVVKIVEMYKVKQVIKCKASLYEFQVWWS